MVFLRPGSLRGRRRDAQRSHRQARASLNNDKSRLEEFARSISAPVGVVPELHCEVAVVASLRLAQIARLLVLLHGETLPYRTLVDKPGSRRATNRKPPIKPLDPEGHD